MVHTHNTLQFDLYLIWPFLSCKMHVAQVHLSLDFSHIHLSLQTPIARLHKVTHKAYLCPSLYKWISKENICILTQSKINKGLKTRLLECES